MSLNRKLDFMLGVPLVKGASIFSPKRRIVETPKNILIIKLAAAGDTVLLGAVLKSFRQAHPHASIDWLVSPINYPIAKLFPVADRLIVWTGGMAGLFSLVWKICSNRYDAVCDVDQWARGTALLAFLSGAPIRVGFRTEGQYRDGLFTDIFEKRYDQHEIFDFYGLLERLGPLARTTDLTIPVTEAGEAECMLQAPFLFDARRGGLRVLVHPGCGADGGPREWPIGNYGVLSHWLIKRYNAQIVLTSGPEERKKTLQLNRLLDGAAQDVGGKMSWEGLIALVFHADLVISGNTGVMHIAAALKKKQVALHGPTNPLLWGPMNERAKVVQTRCPKCPCLKLGFEYHAADQSCMAQIDVEDVKTAVSGLVDSSMSS